MKKYFLCLIISFVLLSTFIPTSETSATTDIETKENEISMYCLKCDKSSTIIDNADSDNKNPIKPDIINVPSSFSWIDYINLLVELFNVNFRSCKLSSGNITECKSADIIADVYCRKEVV